MERSVRHRVRVRVHGELAPSWSLVLGDLAVAAEPAGSPLAGGEADGSPLAGGEADGSTLISGELADQAAVHGLLAAIRDLGLSLISIETVAVPGPATPTGVSSCRS